MAVSLMFGSLYDCFMAIHEGKASESILDIYSDVRREKWKTIVDPQSQPNHEATV